MKGALTVPQAWELNAAEKRRMVIYAEGYFSPLRSKTANAAVRYLPEQVLAIIDSTQAGRTAGEVLGYGGGLPVFATLQEALALRPDTLLLGIAPFGGGFPESWRPLIREALQAGLDLINGLHTLLGDDPELRELAEHCQRRIFDLRRVPPAAKVIAKGSWKQRRAQVVLTVGTDANVGKMTAMMEIQAELLRLGVKTGSVATGQTGLLLLGRGLAIDSIEADFLAGSIERVVDQLEEEGCELILVEGQGALTHQAFSGISLGLLHGCMPDQLIMCHQPARATDYYGLDISDLVFQYDLYKVLMRPFKPVALTGIAVNSVGLTEEESGQAVLALERQLGIPAQDVVTQGARRLAESVASVAAECSR